MEYWAHFFTLLALVLAAYLAVFLRSLIGSVIALAAMSLILSLEFYLLQAPDVAIAEAGIGAGLTTAIFIFALRGVRRD
ncbi:MAG: DUF4040 domain-containing protein [Synergistetes bacterium]|nr:DUF4040 domain-containing protein [Synergistota bacterium]